MKRITILIVLLIVLILGFAVYQLSWFFFPAAPTNSSNSVSDKPLPTTLDIPEVTVIADNLDTPWAIAFLPDTSMLVTERPGRVRRITADGTLQSEPVATISEVKEIGEGGLLGITLHPDFANNHFVYIYYTYSANGNDTQNRVVRMTYEQNKLTKPRIIVDAIPGASNHNGGRIKFGPDHFLYIATGDAENPSQAQNTQSLAGKILRATDTGQAAPGNPFNNRVYSYGHRNVQGLAWDASGQLWATEHGRSGALSGLDEINKIQKGANYGWPTIQGNETRNNMESPYRNSGNTTWAPSGLAFLDGSLYFGGLRGQSLYRLNLTDSNNQVEPFLTGEFGRVRDVVLGPDTMLYITTSNRDGRGNPVSSDDRVIRINPQKL